jgi:hypothetical protein
MQPYEPDIDERNSPEMTPEKPTSQITEWGFEIADSRFDQKSERNEKPFVTP